MNKKNLEFSEAEILLAKSLKEYEFSRRTHDKLQKAVMNHLDEFVTEWAEENGFGSTENEFYEKANCMIWLPHWHDSTGKKPQWTGYFYFDEFGDESEDDSWLTVFTAQGYRRFVLRFAQDPFNKSSWKKFLQTKVDQLSSHGFQYEDNGSWRMEILIQKESLVAFLEGDNDDVWQPVKDALDTAFKARLFFDGLLTEMAELQRNSA